MKLSRRTLLSAGAATALAAATPPFATALGAAPARAQAPGFQRTRVGEAVVTALLDGAIDIAPQWWVNVEPEALQAALERQFLPTDAPLRISVNAYVIETAETTIAIDIGAAGFFGPTAGHWPKAFDAAGYRPEDIDLVLLTHAHPDHIGGLIAGDTAVFPRAEVKVNAAELDYWTSSDHEAAAPDYARPWFGAVRTLARLYGDRLTTFAGDVAVAPGVTAVPLPGHTPGHGGFVLESAGDRLFFWGDVTDFLALQLANPSATLIFDVDKALGEESRRRAFEVAVAERMEIAGSHVVFPSFGHIAREDGRLRFVPSRWRHEI